MRAAGNEGPEVAPSLLEGLREPTKEFLLQTLLYKSIFIGQAFRALVAREDAPLRERLLAVSHESAAEALAVSVLAHEWDKHPAAWDPINACTEETRVRLLRDLVMLKEGMVETGLSAAMRAPNVELRQRFLKLVDVDRRHAEELRGLMGLRALGEKARSAGVGPPAEGLGAHDRRRESSSLGGTVRETLRELESRGLRCTRLVVGPAGARHLRDEEALTGDGRCFGLHVELDMGWEGDAFAIETDQRMSYAELVTAARQSRPEGPAPADAER